MTALSDISLQFKGGQLHDLYKSGETDIPENYRDILLADDVGKSYRLMMGKL